jgi:hypothetical protein
MVDGMMSRAEHDASVLRVRPLGEPGWFSPCSGKLRKSPSKSAKRRGAQDVLGIVTYLLPPNFDAPRQDHFH